MTNTLYSTDQITASSYVLFMSPGDTLFVKSGVLVASTASGGEAIAGNSGTSAYILGTLYGDTGISDIAGTLYVGSSGSIMGNNNAVSLLGGINLENFGTISGSQGAIAFDVAGPTYVYNIYNAGLIDGGASYSFSDPQGSAQITNVGVMKGDVVLPSGHNVFNSSLGQVFGTIYAGGGDTIVAGMNGGNVIGGAGNDNLQANQSATAAGNHVHFTLDGAGGTNALYGGGAFTTFDAGDAAGGHNQIHGGLSQMSDVTGYANNTLDFSKTPSTKSAYVDLLTGRNAYLYAGANHSGALTFEDSIQNVPNVIGSAGGDLIRADNGTDTIQGGGGGDILYAGAGADTFVYKGYADSNTVNGYDTISGFATGKDKLDLSALNSDPSHLSVASSSSSTTLYLEKTAGTFNSATDLAISFTGAHAIAASDVIF